jgi:hypothetical protein
MVAEADENLQAAIDESSHVVSGIAKRSRELASQNMKPVKCMCLLLRSARAVGPTKKAWGTQWRLDAHRRFCRLGERGVWA